MELVTLTNLDWNRLEGWLWSLKNLRNAINTPISMPSKALESHAFTSERIHPSVD